MPNSGDSQNGYTWYDAPEDEKGQALPKGWYSDEDGSFSGAGAAPTGAKGTTSQDGDENITAQALYEQETGQTWPPMESEYAGSKKMVPDKSEMRYWQTQAFAQRKAAREAKAAEAKALEERTYSESQAEAERKYKESQAQAEAAAKAAETKRLEDAKAAETARKEALTQPSVNDALSAAFERGQQSGDFTEYQNLLAASKPPPAPAKTPTIDELIVEAILSGNNEAALALWDFANMPSQAERLKMAIAASQSPADYLATVGMMRGEIPIPQQPAGSYRLGPESQAFEAYGVGGQGGGGQGAGGGPLGDPALQSFLKARGGGGAQAGAPGGQGSFAGAMGTFKGQLAGGQQGQPYEVQQDSPALQLIDRQIQALMAAGDSAETPEEQAQIQQQMTALQTQRQQAWQSQNQSKGQQPTFQGAMENLKNQLGAGQQGGGTSGTQSGNTNYDAWVYSTDPNKGSYEDWLKARNYDFTEGGMFEPVSPGSSTYVRSAKGRADPGYRGGPASTQAATGNAGWDALSPSQQAYQRANGQSPASYSLSTTSNQAATGKLPSFLEGAYGKEALSGAALKQRMSYPELAERQGVTVPRFRSAQARSMQTPLERRMFEAGLQQQGIDLPTWLEQEQAGTTPGGSRRRRIQTGF